MTDVTPERGEDEDEQPEGRPPEITGSGGVRLPPLGRPRPEGGQDG